MTDTEWICDCRHCVYWHTNGKVICPWFDCHWPDCHDSCIKDEKCPRYERKP
jgi:hypothetical protein